MNPTHQTFVLVEKLWLKQYPCEAIRDTSIAFSSNIFLFYSRYIIEPCMVGIRVLFLVNILHMFSCLVLIYLLTICS